MAVKILTEFKKLAIFGVALPGFLVLASWTARADPTNQTQPVWKQPNSNTVIVAQNDSQTATNDKSVPSSESKELESKTDEKKEPSGVKKKPLKDFRPSEKIEAEQAVDFPYDI